MKEIGIKERITNEIVNSIIKGEQLKDFYIKLFTSSGEIYVDDIGDELVKKREGNPKLEERFPTRQSIIHELAKHVIATNNSKYIYHFMTNTYSAPKDELSDALIATKDYEKICSLASIMYSGLKVNKFVDILVKHGDTYQIYNFIENSFANESNRFEEGDNKQEILDKLIYALIKKDGRRYIISLANSNIPGVTMSILEDWAIGTSSLAIYDFARKVKKADKTRLMDALIELGDDCYIFHFANDVEGADINKLFDAIVKNGDDHWFHEFIEEIDGLSKDKIVEGIIERKDFSYIFENKIKLTKNQMDAVVDKVITLGAEAIYNFADELDNMHIKMPIKKLTDAIIQTGDAEYIYKFAMDIFDAPLDRVGNALINIGNPTYIFLYAKEEAEGINVEKYANAMIKAGDVYWMYKFAKEVKYAPVDKLEKAILKLAK